MYFAPEAQSKQTYLWKMWRGAFAGSAAGAITEKQSKTFEQNIELKISVIGCFEFVKVFISQWFCNVYIFDFYVLYFFRGAQTI